MSNIVNNYTSTIVSIFHSVIQNYEKNEKTIKEIEAELNDISHEIELSPGKDLYGGWRLYDRIRQLRIQRRRCKEENELLKESYEYLTGVNAQNFKTKMQQLQSSAAKLRDVQEKRTYKPRVRDDLTIVGETSTNHQSFEQMISDWKKEAAHMRNGKLRK